MIIVINEWNNSSLMIVIYNDINDYNKDYSKWFVLVTLMIIIVIIIMLIQQ